MAAVATATDAELEAPPAPVTSRDALTSSASADWGTPEVLRQLAAVVLRPAAFGESAIDVDGASSEYWHRQWSPKTRPLAYLDGAEGRDGADPEHWRAMIASIARLFGGDGKSIGSVFKNPPGDPSGGSVQAHWAVLDQLHRQRVIDSVFWVGFSLEQTRSLLPSDEAIKAAASPDDLPLHPLDARACSIFPGRRVSYMAHPEAMIEIINRRLARKPTGGESDRLRRRLAELRTRADDSPVPGPAPTHSSYLTILWSHTAATRRRQQHNMREFLRAQSQIPGSVIKRAAVIGDDGKR